MYRSFADDTAIVGCIRSGQEDEYRELIKDFVTWCDLNHLLLNITKTREMVVDFRRPRPHPEPVIIKGDCVEVVHTYKYLGVCSWMINWTGLPTQTLCAGKERTEPPVLPQKAGVLQHLQEAATADLLPVCGSERPPVRSSVLGGQPQTEEIVPPPHAILALQNLLDRHQAQRPLGLNSALCDWIPNFLIGQTGRPQAVRMGSTTSSTLILNTDGAPQGCVLNLLLYTPCSRMNDCVATHSSNTIVKFADDTTIIDLITGDDEMAYREEVRDLTSWCQDNNLHLNVSKTKGADIVDFRRRQREEHAPLSINGTTVERVSSFRFLGVHISEDLTWTHHTDFITSSSTGCGGSTWTQGYSAASTVQLPYHTVALRQRMLLSIVALVEVCQELRGESSMFQLPEEEESLLSLLYQVALYP
ncbi:hypothetical protein L3Q82_004497 [Scortum barcoo]|uniref:Uncharacterized protein n=1 Tax=Scortum barcoo TaxID=214431 RepID=A0ACB8VKK9_9TELE|nr:hypothetical protein L3Q82_004497 [Scortum barcoo]